MHDIARGWKGFDSICFLLQKRAQMSTAVDTVRCLQACFDIDLLKTFWDCKCVVVTVVDLYRLFWIRRCKGTWKNSSSQILIVAFWVSYNITFFLNHKMLERDHTQMKNIDINDKTWLVPCWKPPMNFSVIHRIFSLVVKVELANQIHTWHLWRWNDGEGIFLFIKTMQFPEAC